MLPDEFLRWWFANAQRHGLAADYAKLYAHYSQAPDAIPYVWQHFRRRMRLLAGLMSPDKRMLDIGCGLGTEVLWASLRGVRAVGLELHRLSLDIAQRRKAILTDELGVGLPCEFRYQNVFEVLVGERYDIIFLREAFHHIEPRTEAVAKIAELLAPGGHLIIEEPNGWNPLIQLRLFKIRGRRTVVIKTDPENGRQYPFGNERITTPGNLARLFAPHGIAMEHVYFRILPTVLARIGCFTRAAQAVEPILEHLPLAAPLFLHYSCHGYKATVGSSADTG